MTNSNPHLLHEQSQLANRVELIVVGYESRPQLIPNRLWK